MEAQLYQGEREAIRQCVRAGRQYGFGNLISYLQTEWALTLMRECGFDEESARRGAGGSGYPFEWHEKIIGDDAA